MPAGAIDWTLSRTIVANLKCWARNRAPLWKWSLSLRAAPWPATRQLVRGDGGGDEPFLLPSTPSISHILTLGLLRRLRARISCVQVADFLSHVVRVISLQVAPRRPWTSMAVPFTRSPTSPDLVAVARCRAGTRWNRPPPDLRRQCPRYDHPNIRWNGPPGVDDFTSWLQSRRSPRRITLLMSRRSRSWRATGASPQLIAA